MKSKVDVLAKLHPKMFFMLQLDSILINAVCVSIHMTSLQLTKAQSLGYTRGMYVSATVNTDL